MYFFFFTFLYNSVSSVYVETYRLFRKILYTFKKSLKVTNKGMYLQFFECNTIETDSHTTKKGHFSTYSSNILNRYKYAQEVIYK